MRYEEELDWLMGRSPPAPKWTRYGRWNAAGDTCYALLDHKQSRAPYTMEQIIYTTYEPKGES